MALDRAIEPAMIARMRPAAASLARGPFVRRLVACAMAAFACSIYAGEVPHEQPTGDPGDSQDADLSPSIAPLSWQTVPSDTVLLARDAADSVIADWTVIATADVVVPEAVQIRVHFAEWFLPGDENVDGAMLRITSPADGATQILGAAQMHAWSGAPAYFNGGSVRLELLVRGSRDLWSGAFARVGFAEALSAAYTARTICDTVDDRVPEVDPIMARIMPVGCSATIIQDFNASFLTAGHCGPASGAVVQFNVPLSTTSGSPVAPPPADQFPVDISSVQRQSEGSGQDWSYFGAYVNSTGLTPGQRQGAGVVLAPATPTDPATQLRISGYGTTSSPISSTWNQILKTHFGFLYSVSGTRLRHRVDTTGGNSGSAVLLDQGPAGASRTMVGIHTHAGCSTTATSSNIATVIEHPNLQAALAAPRGVCASGTATVEATSSGQLWVGLDAANNLGIIQIDEPAGAFAARAKLPATIQAMALDPATRRIIAITHSLQVYSIDPDSAHATLVGPIVSANGTSLSMITGLAIASDGQWYAVAQATSELFRINPDTRVAQRMTSLGALGALRLGALEADVDARYLLALDDNVVVGTRLIEIDLAPAIPTYRIVGTLGVGATDCNALARTGDSRWLTADVSTGRLLQINRDTGAGTFVANLQGAFLGGLGMAWVDAPSTCIADLDGSGGIDGSDLAVFFVLFETGEPGADLDASGGIDGSDLAVFFTAYERGC